MPFLSYMKGIHRAAAQRGPAALSILTSASSPYGDTETEEGVLYAYARARSTSEGCARRPIHVPERRSWRPDRELLSHRFDRFLAA